MARPVSNVCKLCGNPRDLSLRESTCKECKNISGRNDTRRFRERSQLTPEGKASFLAKARLADTIRKLRKFGLTLDQYNQILLSQGFSCGICLSTESGGHGRWHLDHDHYTGKFRGLLCHNCNRALGLFKDSPHNLTRALQYLAKSL